MLRSHQRTNAAPLAAAEFWLRAKFVRTACLNNGLKFFRSFLFVVV